MFDFLRTRIRQGTRTTPFPVPADTLPERYRGLPIIHPAAPAAGAAAHVALPSASDRPGTFDVGACLFSPEEAGPGPAGTVTYSREYRMASGTRAGLITTTGGVEPARALDAEARRLFGRSLRLRSVSAGSCGGCEAELVALGNVVFDLARFGVQFVASPRHADGLVITGAFNRNMRFALEDTWRATPAPRIVIAVGACAIAGGPFLGSPEIADTPAIPVDLFVPGCPPHPLTVLDGLLRLLGRLAPDRVERQDPA